jgi:hypothetical protein
MATSRCSSTLLCCAVLILAGSANEAASDDPSPIDRHALVSRHDVIVREIDPAGALAVGNGEFAFNCDVTGMQSFPQYYEKTMPIGILSNWGWHSFPNPEGYTLDNFKMTVIQKHQREFVFPSSSTSRPAPHAAYLRANPHRFGLGRIGLVMLKADGARASITDLKNIEQKLDLWRGVLTSSFQVDDTSVRVETAVHPARDEVAIAVQSPLVASGRLKIRLAFPYATAVFGPAYEDWTHPDSHQTVMTRRGTDEAHFARTLDSTQYYVRAKWSDGAMLSEAEKHAYLLSGSGERLELAAWFATAPIEAEVDSAAAVIAASRDGWQKHWSSGGAIDLSGNDDPRAAELERRIVLSQYVMAVHDAGSLPPQETGLAVNSWFGKFHLEMYWWHAAHWALWGRPEILEKSLNSLPRLMPAGRAMAKREGCKGVKWSKMTDPGGSESPSGVGPVLVWQQPHPIYLAELVWRAHKNDAECRAILERYKDIVFDTADYMATFVDYDPERKQYVLGPGVASADEKHTDYAHNLNPTMELGYWKWALETAQQWRVRSDMPRDELWDKVINGLAPLTVRNGVYPALEFPVENNAATMTTFLYGILPGKDIDKEAMRNTLHAVTRSGRPQSTVTWGTAMLAMCAARLGEPDRAIQLLAGPSERNPFRPSGYTVRRPEQTPMYMPANGGWLAAVAMMAAGWDGNTARAPGFPKNWKVRYEGLLPMP